MKSSIEKLLKDLDEEYIHHVEILDGAAAFVVCKREHEVTPFLIRGFCIRKGFYDRFFACADETAAKLKFNQILS